MKPRCQNDVEAYLGRPVTAAEIKKIEDNLGYHLKQTQAEAAAKGWSPADALREAAIRATNEWKADVAKKAQRLSLDIAATAAKQERYEFMKAMHGPTKALGKMIEESYTYMKGTQAQAMSRIVEVIDAAEPRFLKMMENPAATRDFVYEVFGKDSGNPVAKKAAQAWLEAGEQQRVRANRAGFNIGKLDYGYVPQPHDVVRMLKAGRQVWVGKMLTRVDRNKYLNDDGSLMSDADMLPMLERAFDTITTNGTNKMDPAAYQGAGGRANRGSSHREIHFADADAYLEHMGEFGRGTVWDAMKGHVDSTANSIGIVEQFGPNPQRLFDLLHRQAIKDNGGVEGNYGGYLVNPRTQWDSLSGNAAATVNPNLANWNQGMRNLQVAQKLGSTFLAAGNDIAVTVPATALFNHMPVMRTIGAIFGSLGKESKQFAAEAGLAVDSIIGDMNAFAHENFRAGWTRKLATGVMKASLLQGWTHSMQRGFSLQMMDFLADLSGKKDWNSLAPGDVKRFKDAGVTEADWQIWRDVPRQDWNGRQLIHHNDIVARGAGGNDAVLRAHDHAASQLLGYIASQADGALVIPDNYTQAALIRGLKKGTAEGEAIRHVALFKGYTAALGHRFIGRMAELDMNVVGKAGLMASFATAMSLMGAVGLQLKSLAMGQDPIDMTGKDAGKFWFKAFAKGGGGGILGDAVATAIEGAPGRGIGDMVLGPVAGTITDFATMTAGQAGKKARGEKTDFAAEALRFARGNTPIGAPLNLWYTRAAVDHMFWHDLQEQASPGYLQRQAARAQKMYGQANYWRPGHLTPDRAPNLAKMAGK